MRKHPNGKPYVIIFFDSKTDKMMREEVYFPNGKMQWEGNYKNMLEDGKWMYYFENGNTKEKRFLNYLINSNDRTSKLLAA